MTNHKLYETKITDGRWIAYDIPGNAGWIAYFAGLLLCFIKRPDFMQDKKMAVIMLLAVIPAVLMLVGVIELIHERICRLDRILPYQRLLRGFGALTLGGIAGMVIALAGICGAVLTGNAAGLLYLIVMCAGGALCAVFAGLLFRGYREMQM